MEEFTYTFGCVSFTAQHTQYFNIYYKIETLHLFYFFFIFLVVIYMF